MLKDSFSNASEDGHHVQTTDGPLKSTQTNTISWKILNCALVIEH